MDFVIPMHSGVTTIIKHRVLMQRRKSRAILDIIARAQQECTLL